MQTEEDVQTTLREDILASVEQVTAKDEPVEETEAATDDIGETAEEKADRERDEKGRFAPKSEAKPTGDLAPPQEPVKPKPQRPSTWKKDHWESFDRLAAENPALAEYINQREGEYAKGVSTYKAEADRAREIYSAIEPFMPELQAHNIQPGQWIQNLGRAHQTLAMGSPQQKLQMFQRLAQDYQVPLQALLPQGEGQQAIGPEVLQFVNPLYEQINQLQGQVKTWQSQQEQQRQAEIQSEIERFKTDKPHFEQVRETMAGLLQSGLAQDLDSAYQAAVRMPQHDEIFQATQQQQREESERRQAEERRATADRARKQAVSTRPGVPTAPRSKSSGNSGLRDTIAEQVEAVMGGRV